MLAYFGIAIAAAVLMFAFYMYATQRTQRDIDTIPYVVEIFLATPSETAPRMPIRFVDSRKWFVFEQLRQEDGRRSLFFCVPRVGLSTSDYESIESAFKEANFQSVQVDEDSRWHLRISVDANASADGRTPHRAMLATRAFMGAVELSPTTKFRRSYEGSR